MGRIFKLDGWNPIAELRAGIWARPHPYSDAEIVNSIEISATEANKHSYFSDSFIHSDNAAAYYLFFESIYASATNRYQHLSKSIETLSKTDFYFKNDYSFSTIIALFTWIDCLTSAVSFFARLPSYQNKCPDFNKEIVRPFFNEYGIGLVRMVFNFADNNKIKDSLYIATNEFSKAQKDENRIEDFFMQVFDDKSIKNFDQYDKNLFCLLNRFYYRTLGSDEMSLIHTKDSPFCFDDIFGHIYFADIFEKIFKEISYYDQKIWETVKKEG